MVLGLGGPRKPAASQPPACPVSSAGSSRSSVANSLPRSVVTKKFLSSPVSSCVARLVARPTVSAFLFCNFHGGLPGEDVHHHQAVLRLPLCVLAEVDEVGLQPVVRPTCPARAAESPAPAGPRRPSRRGRAASRVGTASAGPAR